MSTDNGIYILKTKDEWRVTHAQAIDNLFWWHIEGGSIDQYEMKNEINPSVLYSYFKNSKVLKSKEEAWHEAMILLRSRPFVEYGISLIDGWEEKEFPKQCCEKPNYIVYDHDLQVHRCMNCGEYL